MRNTAVRTIALLKRKVGGLAENVRPRGEAVLAREGEITKRLEADRAAKITATRIRCHGDYHLGQVLHTGNDFVIIDYEGEPTRSINERQIKASPFRDVAGMIRSFDYACYSALADQIASLSRGHDELQRLRGWMQFWTAWTSAAFLKSYMAVAHGQPFVPHGRRFANPAGRISIGKGPLRTALRVEQPPRMGPHSAVRHSGIAG